MKTGTRCIFFAKKVLMQQRIMERARTAEMNGSSRGIFTSPDVILYCGPGGAIYWKCDEFGWV